MDNGKGEWTSRADNGRKFRGEPRDREGSSVTRQFKKPRKTGADKVLPTVAIEPQLGCPLWVLERIPETEELILLDEAIPQAQVVIETIESTSSEEDNIPIAQTRLKNCKGRKDSVRLRRRLHTTFRDSHKYETKVRFVRHRDRGDATVRCRVVFRDSAGV
jgi:hypothetical protein